MRSKPSLLSLPWIEAEFGMSERTARNFMNVFETFGSNRDRVADLIPTALYLLAVPSMPEEVGQEVLYRADNDKKRSVTLSSR